MNELSELLEYCEEHKNWLSFNYSPFDKSYQIYVNPGRTMSSAKRHKTLADAVRSCWLALGGKPNPKWESCTNIKIPYNKESHDKLIDKMIDAACGVEQPKRRGRPKGSKNKPKVEA